MLSNKVNEAAKYVPLSRLGVTTQCGFGTMKEGNPTTVEAQWGKVTLLGTLGKRIWGDK
jgi:methionine synthase II (cobalamin-independent)